MTDDNTTESKVKVLELHPNRVVSVATTKDKLLADLGRIVLSSVQKAVTEINLHTEQEEVVLTIVLPKIQIDPKSSDQ